MGSSKLTPTSYGTGPYRPPQWGQALGIQTLMLVFPGAPNAAQYSSEGVNATLPSNQTVYVFDVTPRIDHDQRVTKTTHPVQTGASISDHAYLEPARLTIEVGMSDAMDAYAPGLWIGGATKSVSAYQVLLAMQFARIPLVVITRLRTYQNMLIINNPAEETVETVAGLKCRVTFEEIFVADTQVVSNSARPYDTNQTQTGQVHPTPPTAAQVSSSLVPSSVASSIPKAAAVFGSGEWSSANVSNLPNLIPGGL
jgi:hypothetical protein